MLRYEAKSGSIYLKLDSGVAGTIRISDHEGKGHLKYRYNLILHHPLELKIHEGYERFYFPMQKINMMIDKIIFDRRVKIEKYGGAYGRFVHENSAKHVHDTKGFWATAKRV